MLESSRSDPATAECPACGALGLTSFYGAREIPTHSNLLMDSPLTARADRGGVLDLASCGGCGFITNRAFDPQSQALSTGYEASQAASPTFGGFARDLAAEWIARYHLAGRRSLEIGCGQGEFTALFAELSGGECVGIDPIVDPARVPKPAAGSTRFFAEPFGARHAELVGDFVCCRHTLEHIARPYAFLRELREAIGDRRDVVVAFEVPDTLRVLREAAFWDLYYEHCSYFTPGSLARTFRRAGFVPLDLRLYYSGQYLVIEARPDGSREDGRARRQEQARPLPFEEDASVTAGAVAGFTTSLRPKLGFWTNTVRAERAAARTVALWGAGSKAVGFLTQSGLGEEVACVVDINPKKQGTYLPGTGHPIVGPAALDSYRPDTVIVMNPVYTAEITRDLGARGLSARVLVLT